MIVRIGVLLRRIRRFCSRSEWLARLLRLPPSTSAKPETGLLMVQIDGLSHSQISRALERGEMPFLSRLIQREHYCLQRQFAGLPSGTAAFQGELFYGVKAVVPGFNFRDSASGRLVRMFEPSAAADVERQLQQRGGPALLAEGSSYVNNYTGGASEAHFCPAALGWGPSLQAANPLVLLVLIVSNLYSFARIGVLLLIELALAVVDFWRGLNTGHNFFKELKFVPTRVAVSILLRELATIGAKIDLARGLPIIHLNFLGYDEQAHRRGPSSLFAHWTLKGIDDAIGRLWRAAQRASGRHYELWIYSDHGQQDVQPYIKRSGRSIEQAVAATFAELGLGATTVPATQPVGGQMQRVRQLGGNKIQRLFPTDGHDPEHSADDSLKVAGLGPVALVYCETELAGPALEAAARALVEQADVPMVLLPDGPARATAWTARGRFSLPGQAAEVLGADHPYLAQASEALIEFCHHPETGQFVLCGWCAGSTACSFAFENGAHGGVGPEETNAFLLLPDDAVLPAATAPYRRAIDLRQAAMHLLGRSEIVTRGETRRARTQVLRVLTYNVHSCIGMDGRLSPERIARVIARCRPDVVALQELDVGRVRTGGLDQAHLIAHRLQMDFHFHPALHVEEERYGDAILTHWPVRLLQAQALPGLRARPGLEPRGALWVLVDIDGCEVQILNTHLGLLPSERDVQIEALLGPHWLGNPECRSPLILCGDFNALPSSAVYRRLGSRLTDAQLALEGHRPRSTFFARFPTARIDHIFIGAGLEVSAIEVPDSELARVASDHLPLLAELRLSEIGSASAMQSVVKRAVSTATSLPAD